MRTPHDLVQHMDSVLGCARTFFVGGQYRPPREDTFERQGLRFHEMLESLSSHLEASSTLEGTTPRQLLQGPFADAMTHAGQLAMLRRLAGCPVPPENFIVAAVETDNVGPDQALPVSPDSGVAREGDLIRPPSELAHVDAAYPPDGRFGDNSA